MIKIIMGLKGTGKTKALIEQVNLAVNKDNGNVVCVEKDSKLRYDISHKARLISTDDFKINTYDQFYGFITGIIAGNYDISSIYVDSIMKICEGGLEEFENFLKKLDSLSSEINIVITASYDVQLATDEIKKYF